MVSIFIHHPKALISLLRPLVSITSAEPHSEVEDLVDSGKIPEESAERRRRMRSGPWFQQWAFRGLGFRAADIHPKAMLKHVTTCST